MAKLDLITIASPCSASWEAMEGDDRVRHCKQCHLDVYDLSNMRRDEAERFVAANEGEACVRFLQRPDGTVITEDCAPRRESPPRPCVAGPAPARPSLDADRAMAAKPRPPSMKMGKIAMPPPEAEPDPIDERLSAGTILADVVRAVRSAFEARDAERLTREIERLVTPPSNAKPAKCTRNGCALWIPEEKEPVVDGFDMCELRMRAVEEVRAAVAAAFEESRSKLLLRELSRHPFEHERGPCPHCKRQIRAPGTADW